MLCNYHPKIFWLTQQNVLFLTILWIGWAVPVWAHLAAQLGLGGQDGITHKSGCWFSVSGVTGHMSLIIPQPRPDLFTWWRLQDSQEQQAKSPDKQVIFKPLFVSYCWLSHWTNKSWRQAQSEVWLNRLWLSGKSCKVSW